MGSRWLAGALAPSGDDGSPDDDPGGVGQGRQRIIEVGLAGSRVLDVIAHSLDAQPRAGPGVAATLITAVRPPGHLSEPGPKSVPSSTRYTSSGCCSPTRCAGARRWGAWRCSGPRTPSPP